MDLIQAISYGLNGKWSFEIGITGFVITLNFGSDIGLSVYIVPNKILNL